MIPLVLPIEQINHFRKLVISSENALESYYKEYVESSIKNGHTEKQIIDMAWTDFPGSNTCGSKDFYGIARALWPQMPYAVAAHVADKVRNEE